MPKTEAEIAAEKAEAEKKAAEEAAAKAAKEGDKGPSAEERKAAEEKRAAESKAQEDKLKAADEKIAKLDESIKGLRAQISAAAAKGKSTEELEARLAESERRQADVEKLVLESHEREKNAIERANNKTLETDLRTTLSGKLVDEEALGFAVDSLISKGKVRVDADGKVAVISADGKWLSLTPDAILAHVPKALQAAKGVPGGGNRGPSGEIQEPGNILDRVKTMSQSEFNKAVDEGKIPDGSMSRISQSR